MAIKWLLNGYKCLKIGKTPKPNGLADHYPVFKWLAIIGNINPTFSVTNPNTMGDFLKLPDYWKDTMGDLEILWTCQIPGRWWRWSSNNLKDVPRKFRAIPRWNLSDLPTPEKNTPEGKTNSTNSKRFDFPTTFHRPHPTDLPEFPSCNGNGKPDPKQSSYGRHFGPPWHYQVLIYGGFSINGAPKWMVYNGKSSKND